jgi:hypothetical protein
MVRDAGLMAEGPTGMAAFLFTDIEGVDSSLGRAPG